MGGESMRLSGGFLDGRAAWSWAGTPSERAPRRPSAGFWRVGGRVEGDQELRKRLADAGGCEGATVWPLGALPGETPILDSAAGQAELGVGEQHQPGPAISLLGVADARGGPVEGLLAEAVGVLQVEAVDVRSPEDGEVGRTRAAPPQPELLGDAGLARQPLDLDQHQGAVDDGPGTPTAPSGMVLRLRVHVGPRPHPHRPVLGMLLAVLHGRRPPAGGVVAGQLPPMTTRATGARLLLGIGV